MTCTKVQKNNWNSIKKIKANYLGDYVQLFIFSIILSSDILHNCQRYQNEKMCEADMNESLPSSWKHIPPVKLLSALITQSNKTNFFLKCSRRIKATLPTMPLRLLQGVYYRTVTMCSTHFMTRMYPAYMSTSIKLSHLVRIKIQDEFN